MHRRDRQFYSFPPLRDQDPLPKNSDRSRKARTRPMRPMGAKMGTKSKHSCGGRCAAAAAAATSAQPAAPSTLQLAAFDLAGGDYTSDRCLATAVLLSGTLRGELPLCSGHCSRKHPLYTIRTRGLRSSSAPSTRAEYVLSPGTRVWN